MLGMIIMERFDIPETLIAVSSSVFLFYKNQIPDNKITNGKSNSLNLEQIVMIG